MSDELHTYIEPELEARIVAWVLGEASAFEAEEMERLTAEQPELAIFKRRIEAVHGLVREAARPAGDPLKLSAERRAKVLRKFGEAARENRKVVGAKQNESRWPRKLGLVAAVLIIGLVFAGLFFPAISSVKESARKIAKESSVRDHYFAAQSADAPVPSAVSTPESATDALAALQQQLGGEGAGNLALNEPAPSTTGFGYADGYGGGAARGGVSKGRGRLPQTRLESRTVVSELEGLGDLEKRAEEFEDKDEQNFFGRSAGAAGANHGNDFLARGTAPPASPIPTLPNAQATVGSGVVIDRLNLNGATVGEALEVLKEEAKKQGKDFNVRTETEADDAKITLALKNIPADEALNYVANLAGLKVKRDETGQSLVPQNEPTDVLISKEYRVAPGFFERSTDGRRVNAKEFLESSGVNFPAGAEVTYLPSSDRLVVRNSQENLDLMDVLVSSVLAVPEIEENMAAEEPFSTFSLHVSDVSFKLAQVALERGEMPEADRIRSEEFYNAFDYGDPSPETGEEVACRIEQSAHPVMQQRNLVRMALKVGASGRVAGQPLRLTILLDTSGSMEREDRAASVQSAMKVLASLLGPEDRVSLIGFAREPRLLAENVPGHEAQTLVQRVAQTPSDGGTNLEEALKLASDLAGRHFASEAQNRVVLLTDGAANLGNADPARLAATVDALRQRGIAFDACGVGANGLNDEMLEFLTRKGDGRYYFLDTPEEADQGFAAQLAGAFRPAAENVKVQVRWNPARVGKYRLVGFEKHRLRKEDFRNDKVDAAELAAEEAAVALYQVEVLPEGEGELGEVFVRYREASSGRMLERSWTIGFQPNAPAFDEATGSMQLAGVAAMMAEKLAGTPAGGMVRLDELSPVINQLRGKFTHDQRVQELVRMFEKLRSMGK